MDLKYNNGISWVELKQGKGEASHVIPIYVHGDRAWIGLLRTGLSMEELYALLHYSW